ncbi:hypothetical protein ETB97_003462 [Aspergillus alliaceus]|uniref:Sld7 C-terminal domain-containing protein n=1 Tax=Petromyces alliaceus TaxID=209559 RepID=A0A5N6G7T3_PETAA|nr:uncharacterized protein BDW43DRAFT_264295 [Aspergillus alliaceus]KAB8237807.1 hypothetical protein BDW43DRAFT_264295 [Aspergillus alliaceus]KAE8388831.1 hypothetical protein BDV23DRAFT_194950 [Aspergillus alliaceus]KAF5859026.1 hypothetical protein ETB97_003462 [Aspergillus burnettii]
MNVWSGAIVLDGQSQLQGLQLIDRSSTWSSDIQKDSTLNLRCFVNPALIPLYARVGPNLELHTTDTQTSQWLKSRLLRGLWLEEEDPDKFQTLQCPVGLLVSIDSMARTKPGSTTTDILVYGVLSSTTSFDCPPTPPVSSSASSDEPASRTIRQSLKIYATPISSSLISRMQALPSPQNASGVVRNGGLAEFLPGIRSPSPKRKRVATLFESVARHHKRVRQKGGEGVSQLMAHSHSQSSQQLHTLQIKRESEEPNPPIVDRIALQSSRSLSSGTNLHHGKPSELRTENSRPSSNRGHPREFIKRNTPNPFIEPSLRKEREASPTLPPSDGKLESSNALKDTEDIIIENKNTISRTILTCMRLYGFNRPTTRSGSSSKNPVNHDVVPSHAEEKDPRIAAAAAPLATSTSNADEDEFKAMYHATYRASSFALRKYLKEAPMSEGSLKSLPPLLDKARAMTYIDEFLRLFCEEN